MLTLVVLAVQLSSAVGSPATGTFGKFPGYAGLVTMAGTVTVKDSGDSLSLDYSMSGLEANATGGIHIHSGTSCAEAAKVGGHFWTPLSDPDPWTTAAGATYTSDGTGASATQLTVKSGYNLAGTYGHTVVVHDKAGVKIGCAVLSGTAAKTTVGEACAVDDNCDGGCVSKVCAAYPTGTFGKFPGYAGLVTMAGTVTVKDSGDSLSLDYSMSGLEANATGGIHIHSGTSCAEAAKVGGHFWTPLSDPDPWTTAAGATYTSDGTGASATQLTVKSGYNLAGTYGHTVVVHDKAGVKIGCTVLSGTAAKTEDGEACAVDDNCANACVSKVCAAYPTTTAAPAAATTTAAAACVRASKRCALCHIHRASFLVI